MATDIIPDDAIKFLGHSSIYDELDDYLTEHGIKKRPKWNSSTAMISEKNSEISFEFSESYDEEALTPRKSAGEYVLRAVRFESPAKSGLPFGLNSRMRRDEVDQLLGQPKSAKGTFSTKYFYEQYVVTIRRANNQEIDLVTVSVPDIYNREL